MKIVNKKTGEIIDLSAPKEVTKTQEQKTDERIKDRGTIQESAKKIVTEKSAIKKAIGVAEVADAPFAAIESGISNPALALQKGNVNPQDLLKEAILGFSLQKQGQYGDVMKNAGYNPILADTAGIILHMSPAKVYGEVAKTFGEISKMSDKGMLKAGNNLVTAVNQAKTAVGTKIAQEFAKQADNVPVDGLKFIESVSSLPKPILSRAETAFGSLEDFANGLTIGKIREFKRFLGKLKPNSYGQAERGIQENLDVQDLNKVYASMKKMMVETLSDTKTSGLDKKSVDYLMKLEDTYSDVADAGRFIRKSVVDPVLQTPSKVGEFAKKVSSETDSSARIALTQIKKTSGEAMKRINSAMKEIEGFNRKQATKNFISHSAKAAIYGGVAGGIGGRILRSAQGNQGD